MRLNKKLGLLLGACAATASVLASPLFAEDNSDHKLDAALRLTMAARNNAAIRSKGTIGQQDARVLVKTNDKGAQVQSYLSKNGGQVTSRHGSIVSVKVPYNALQGLSHLSSVSYIEASKKLEPTNDVASGSEYGTKLVDMLKTNKGYTGKGVVVGVIDSGIDTTCDAFNDANGKSRISYFWNMAIDDKTHYPTVITPDGESRTFEYGREYTASDIDAQSKKSPVFTDADGHGTHVCGTIGGRDDKYPGMAPDVNFIVVNNNSDEREQDIFNGAGSGATLDGLEYIISRAKEMNKPLVVNISQGTCMGPHDGSTLFEQAIQADIEENNLIVCISSGNNQDDDKASEVSIPAHESVTVKLMATACLPEQTPHMYGSIDIWTKGNNDIDLKIDDGSNSRTIAYAESIDEGEAFGKYTLTCTKELKSSINGDDRVMVNFVNNSGKKIAYFPAELTLTNNSDSKANVNLYLQRNTDSKFDDHIAPGTIGIPGTTPGAITVGAYTTRTEVDTQSGHRKSKQTLNEICDFSSQGPTRTDKRYTGLNAIKPDIVAPGSLLISQLAAGYEEEEKEDPDYFTNDHHLIMQGTSMSTPVTTGTVALILQNMPNATPAQIKEILFDKALSDAFTGKTPNSIYGHGKLQAASLESDKVVSPQPTIKDVSRNKKNDGDMIITGINFTPACDVFINGELWDSNNVEFIDNTQVIVHNVFSPDSPLRVDGEVIVRTVKFVNRLGKDGANSSEFDTEQHSGDNIADLSSGSGACFIATAAYGSYLEPEVMTLRRFRDRDLMTNEPGRYFVKMYYTYSPPVADFIAAHPSARCATRLALTPLVYSVSHPTEALALAFVLGLTGGAVLYRRRKAA